MKPLDTPWDELTYEDLVDQREEAIALLKRVYLAGWEWTDEFDAAHKDAEEWLSSNGLLSEDSHL